jgi:hypothetical protein
MKDLIWIFLGYSRPDEAKAQDIYERLSKEGFKPWTDIQDVLPGEDMSARVRGAIYNADIFLVCLSYNSIDGRGNLKQDLNEQLNYHLQEGQAKAFLIPVRLEECPMPKSLESLEFVDLFKQDGWAHLLESISSVIMRRRDIEDAWTNLYADLDISETKTEEALAKPSFIEENEEGPLEGPTDPSSAEAWEVDLRKLIGGHRESSLIHLDSVEEYVESHLEEAADSEMAAQAFHEALEKLVQRWQPSSLRDKFNVSYLLDLIGAYTPPGGFVKVIALIHSQRYYDSNVSHEDFLSSGPDLLFKSLVVLENYYIVAPKAPEDSSASYVTYIALLKEELWNPRHSGYALKRLIELRVIDLKSDNIRLFIERTPGILKELVNLMLNPNHRTDAEDDLTRVFIYCFNIGDEAIWEFERAVIQCGGKVEQSNEEQRPIRIIFGEQEFYLSLSKSVLYKYQAMRWKRADREGFSRIGELANSTSG